VIHADPKEYADAGPVVGSGPAEHWGWTVEYDIDIPVEAKYTLQICYASAESRPVNVRVDSKWVGTACDRITFASADATAPTSKSSGAKWDWVTRSGKVAKLWDKTVLTKGKHTVKLTRRQPLPYLVALRLETDAEFPEGWRPPQWKVRDMDTIPAKYRQAFLSPHDDRPAQPPARVLPKTKAAGSLVIPAHTFDRGNARIYASPDRYAMSGTLTGDGLASRSTPPQAAGQAGARESVVEYDIDFPVTAEYTLKIRYAAVEPRPTAVFLDGKKLGRSCTGISHHTANYVRPHKFPANSRNTKMEGLCDHGNGTLMKLSVTRGEHTLKLARRGPLPHLVSLHFDSDKPFPKDWRQPERRIDFSRIPAPQHAAFLPLDAVNTAALRLAIEDTIKTYGPEYPDGHAFLKRLAELAGKQGSAEAGGPEKTRAPADALTALRRESMLAHPLLDFDKLLFLKRTSRHYSHTYAGPQANVMGGSLCVLSPVSPDGEVAELVPELSGGLFGRFDLSFDAKKVVFAYKKKPRGAFRLYEIDIDPGAGTMIPGSLRQLTFGGEEEEEARQRQVTDWLRGGFCDMYPCYLPSGKIIFASTRAQRIVYCAPQAVTTLYVMDADGKNLRRLSENPISETVPTVLNDGRVIYTRWEYLDKGLGSVQNLWAMRPDGRGVDHVYKLNNNWPAGMGATRAIPGSQRMVTVAGNHYHPSMGSVVLLDVRRSRRTTEPMECITPEIPYRHTYNNALPTGAFTDPYPLSEKFFLASYRAGGVTYKPGAEFGLCVLDAWGNRAEFLRDPEISCFEPMPLRPRRKPTEVDAAPTIDEVGKKKTGVMFIQDVYEGMTGIQRGRVKYIRVMGNLEWPWDQTGMSWSLGVDPHRKVVYGVAKVHEDGSACFTVPADENIFFQALDRDYMALQEMATYINVMPGERRSCIGCHEPRRNAPGIGTARPMAMAHPAQTLVPQPGDTGVRMVDFTADIQTIVDKHCIDCHMGKKAKGGLDLLNVPDGKFSRSYNNLIATDLIRYRGRGVAANRAVPPLTHGSRASELLGMLAKGHPSSPSVSPGQAKVKLSREEEIRIATWIDANVPYWGSYRGPWQVYEKDRPDFRLLPLPGETTSHRVGDDVVRASPR